MALGQRGAATASAPSEDGKPPVAMPKAFRVISKGPAALNSTLTMVVGEGTIEPTVEDDGRISILDMGTKGSSKTCKWGGLPRPNGGKTYFISFDEASHAGFKNYWSHRDPDVLKNCVFFEVTRPSLMANGKTYPGYDPNQPQTSEMVLAMVSRILDRLDAQGDCDNIVLDHWQSAHEDIGKSYCFYKANASPEGQIRPQDYAPRMTILKLIFNRAWAIRKHALVMTGYDEEEKLTIEAYFDEKKQKESTRPVKVVQTTKWVERYQAPFDVVLRSWATRPDRATGPRATEANVSAYWCGVESSKNWRFPEGKVFDLTGKDASIWWDVDELVATKGVVAPAAH